MKSSRPTHQEISQHAYQIYVRNGCKHGAALEHWLQAETELQSMMSEAPAAVSATSKAPKAANGKTKTEPASPPAAAAPAGAPAKARAPAKKPSKSAR